MPKPTLAVFIAQMIACFILVTRQALSMQYGTGLLQERELPIKSSPNASALVRNQSIRPGRSRSKVGVVPIHTPEAILPRRGFCYPPFFSANNGSLKSSILNTIFA
jgi:hypothetical protein